MENPKAPSVRAPSLLRDIVGVVLCVLGVAGALIGGRACVESGVIAVVGGFILLALNDAIRELRGIRQAMQR